MAALILRHITTEQRQMLEQHDLKFQAIDNTEGQDYDLCFTNEDDIMVAIAHLKTLNKPDFDKLLLERNDMYVEH